MKYIYTLCILFCANLLYSQEDTMRLDGDFTIPPPKDIDSTIYMMEPFKITVVKNNKVHDKYRFLIFSELAGKVDTIWPQDFWVPIWFISKMKLFEQNKLVIITYASWSFRYHLIIWDGKRWNISMSYNLVGMDDKPYEADIELVNYNSVKYKHGDKGILLEYDIEKKTEKQTVIKE